MPFTGYFDNNFIPYSSANRMLGPDDPQTIAARDQRMRFLGQQGAGPSPPPQMGGPQQVAWAGG